MGLSFIEIKKNVGHILEREWGPYYRRLLRITKVCLAYQFLKKWTTDNLTPPPS